MDGTNKRSSLYSIIGAALLIVMMALVAWTYKQFMISYQDVQTSNQVYQNVLDSAMALNRENVKELNEFRTRLQSTESLLAKVKEENDKLREKLVLLDKMAELQDDISRLKERNVQILNQMSQMEWKSPYREQRLKTVEEAKALMVEYGEKLHLVKARIHDIKSADRQKFIASRKEEDKMQSLLGNNGYLVRNGKISASGIADTSAEQKIKVDVTFVK